MMDPHLIFLSSVDDSISKMSANLSRLRWISSHSFPSYVLNRYKANSGAEYANGEWSNPDSYRGGLEMYETFYRSYNAHNLSRRRRIGRFMQGDPMMEVSMESYVFGKNNPVFFTDFNGALEEECKECKLMDEIVIKKYSFSNAAENVSDWVDLLLASSGVGGSSDWSFLGENNGKGGGGGGRDKSSYKNDTIPKPATKTKSTATEAAITFAISASEADGPLLYGEALGALVIGGALVYDHWDDIVSTTEELTSFFGTLFSKGGKQNKWPDNYGLLQLRQIQIGP